MLMLFYQLTNQQDVLVQQLSLISLSELGRQSDLSSDKTLFESVFNLFNAEDEDTKYYASVALGGICLVNFYIKKFSNLFQREISNTSYQLSSTFSAKRRNTNIFS